MAKILVVEDETDLRELYTDILIAAGYQVEGIGDGQQALSKMSQGGYDLILLDIILPKVDGLTILKTLPNYPSAKTNGPIILLTALDKDETISQGLALGASGYLVKSEVDPAQVLQEVNNFLVQPE
jgi:DNA-binding response OmpR family regulator